MNKIAKFTILSFILFNFLTVFSVSAQGLSNNIEQKFELDYDYDVLIYPNPVTDNKFYVKSDKVIKSVEVIDVLGQNIKTVNNETDIAYNIFVRLGQVKNGMYMVKVTFFDRNTIIQKIIVK